MLVFRDDGGVTSTNREITGYEEPLTQQAQLEDGEKDIRILQHLEQNSLFHVRKYSIGTDP